MKKLRHSKYKNTGFLFELLVRQVTADIIAERKSFAEVLLVKYFHKQTELGKERTLYEILTTKKPISESKADRILNAVIDARTKLSESRLNREKFQLVKEIKDNYNLDEFFRSQLPNYRTLASIYKVFENATSTEMYDPTAVSSAKTTIIECLVASKTKAVQKDDVVLESYKKQDEDIRHLSYRIMLKSFNAKYSGLNADQKAILRETINNVSNTNSLRTFINEKSDSVCRELAKIGRRVNDPVTKIKLKETISQLSTTVKRGTVVKDNQISALLLSYELLTELKNVTK